MNTNLQISEILTLKWNDLSNTNLSDYSLEILEAHRVYRAREQNRIKDKHSFVADDDFVFGNSEGKLRSYSGLSHNFRRFLRIRGLDQLGITLKTLRHFARQQQKKQNRIEPSFALPKNIEMD